MQKSVRWFSWLLGSFLMAFTVKNIYEPSGLVTGGFMGLSILGEEVLMIPLWATNLVLNIPLLLIAARIEGRELVWCTLVVTGIYTVIIGILPEWDFLGADMLVAAVLGGMIMGMGLGIILRTGASSGGVDMISVLLNHRNSKISIPKVMFVLDVVVILLGTLVFGVEKGLYSIVSVWVVSYVTGKLLSPNPLLARWRTPKK